MDALLLGSATMLVLRKYIQEKRSQNDTINEQFKNEIVERVQPENDTEPESSDDEEPPQLERLDNQLGDLGISHNVTSGGIPFAPSNERSIVVNPQHDERNDTSYFDEQFFPSDTRTTGNYSTRPEWLNQEREFHAKEEREADKPTPDDVFGIKERKTIREMGDRYTKDTIHVTKSKTNESSIESIWTGNGNYSTDGYHPKNQAQLYKYLPPDNETINIHSTVQGKVGFKTNSDNIQDTLTDDKREKVSASFSGIPVAPTFKPSSGSSFETNPSNAEGYIVSKHINAASHGPVEKVALKENNSVSTAHNNNVNTFLNMIQSSMFRRSKGDGSMEKSETVFKTKEIERPVVSGAAGGLTSAAPKESEVKTSSNLENLGVRMSGVTSSVGASALVKKKATEGDMLMAEPRLFETENSSDLLRKTSTQLKKSFNIGGDFTSNDDRENINATDLTSNNVLVGPNEALGMNRFNPTGSMSFGRESNFKEESGVDGFGSKLALGFDKSKTNNRSVVSREMEEKEKVSETLFSDRLKALGSYRPIKTITDLSRNPVVDF